MNLSTLFILLQYLLFILIVVILVKPLGSYLTRVFTFQKTWFDPVLLRVESLIYRMSRIDAKQEMDWKQYSVSFILFTLVGTLFLYVILRLQYLLPWFYPEYLTTPLTPDLAMNTSISFATTTTWQAYAGETTMSYFSQLVGLTTQNFLAGASGLAVGIAFIRGFARESTTNLGNFWVDLVRATLWVLLPLSLLGGMALIWQGVPMNFSPYIHATTLEGQTQIIPQGPIAALEFIKNLGTNGGGFFNANGSHPYENPTPLTNFLEMLAIILLPAALTNTFGRMVNQPRQGWTLFWTMMIFFGLGLTFCGLAERNINPQIAALGVDAQATHRQAGGNMEGKEVRFGIHGSVLTAVVTSNGATGSYNSMHDSYMPLGGMIPLINMLLGEIIFGGLGTGLYSMILVVLLALFIGGQMVGRTPEYLGKQVGPTQMKLVALYTIVMPFTVLLLTALAISTDLGKAGLTTNNGQHGFTEIVYAYTSSFANNGQNMAGLSANSPFYNITTALAMIIGRFALAIPSLALAGSFAQQRTRAITVGSMPTDSLIFIVLLIATALIVGGLSFLPVLALGPILEHMLMGT